MKFLFSIFIFLIFATPAMAYTRTPNDVIYSDSYVYNFTDEVGGSECQDVNWGYVLRLRSSNNELYCYSDIISSSSYSTTAEIGTTCYNRDYAQYYDIEDKSIVIGLVPFCSADPIGEPPADSIYNQSYIEDDIHLFLSSSTTTCPTASSTCNFATSTNIGQITAINNNGEIIVYDMPFFLFIAGLCVFILMFVFFKIFYTYGSRIRNSSK